LFWVVNLIAFPLVKRPFDATSLAHDDARVRRSHA
jgi:hypothetical protein